MIVQATFKFNRIFETCPGKQHHPFHQPVTGWSKNGAKRTTMLGVPPRLFTQRLAGDIREHL